MRFDSYTISLLLLRRDAPVLDEAAANALQDAHLSHLAQLHEAGHLLAAGPVLGPPDRELRGFSILRVEPDRARELKGHDPAVRAGRFRVEVYPWMNAAGGFDVLLTRAAAEVDGRSLGRLGGRLRRVGPMASNIDVVKKGERLERRRGRDRRAAPGAATDPRGCGAGRQRAGAEGTGQS